MRDLGILIFFLGIEFSRSQEGILMNQRKYTLEVIVESCLGGAKPMSTPLKFNQKLTSVSYDNDVGSNNIVDHVLDDANSYQRLIGRLVYLIMTKPDISFAVGCKLVHAQAKVSHMNVTLRVVKYIKNALGLGILMSSKETKLFLLYQ